MLTEEEVLDRVTDAIKIFILGDAWRRDRSSYQSGDVYNSIFVGTREPSGMPGTTHIRQGDGSEKPMKDFIGEALAKPENRFRIPLSRNRTYVPFFAPPMVQSAVKNGTLKSNPVASTIIGSPKGMRFFRVRTVTGRELIADGQRRSTRWRRIEPVASSFASIRSRWECEILCSNEEGTQTQLEAVELVEAV